MSAVKMTMNIQKGLFRIYVILDVIIIITFILMIIENGCGYWDDYLPIALIAPLPWGMHYLTKWIIKGFLDKQEPAKERQKKKKKDEDKQYASEKSLPPKKHGRTTIVFRILIISFALIIIPKFWTYWYLAGSGNAIYKYVLETNLKLANMTMEQRLLLQQMASAKGITSALLMMLGYWAPFFSCLLLVTSISSPSKTSSGIWKIWLTYIALCLLGTAFLSVGLPTWNRAVEFPISVVSAAILWLALGGIPAVLALILRAINKRKMRHNPELTTTTLSEKNASLVHSTAGSARSE